MAGSVSHELHKTIWFAECFQYGLGHLYYVALRGAADAVSFADLPL